MLCCKIVADYDSSQGDFMKLFDTLGKKGGVLFSDNNLYFGSVDQSITERSVKSLLKRCGYSQFVIFSYDKDHEPKESDFLNGWLTDWLVKMECKHVERSQQQNFKVLSKKMDELEAQIASELKQLEEDGGK